jgi:hypothetical protein
MNATLFNLYKTSTEWQVLLDKISEADGEITDEKIATEISGILSSGKSSTEDAILARQSLVLVADHALAQAKLFQNEFERCKAVAQKYQGTADRISQALIPVLELCGGRVSTICGTAFIRRTPSYTFSLKDGAQFFDLPENTWRQRDPELNKSVLRELAQNDRLPEQIAVSKSETVSVCLKRPVSKQKGETEQMEGAAA